MQVFHQSILKKWEVYGGPFQSNLSIPSTKHGHYHLQLLEVKSSLLFLAPENIKILAQCAGNHINNVSITILKSRVCFNTLLGHYQNQNNDLSSLKIVS